VKEEEMGNTGDAAAFGDLNDELARLLAGEHDGEIEDEDEIATNMSRWSYGVFDLDAFVSESTDTVTPASALLRPQHAAYPPFDSACRHPPGSRSKPRRRSKYPVLDG
jgi:hypothetical protein